MERLNKQAAQTHANYLQHKVMYDTLKDEVWDQQSTSSELRQELEEYEATTDYLYNKIDNMQSDFDAIISYIDLYYKEERSAREPLYVSKHQVPNRNCKGMKCFLSLFL